MSRLHHGPPELQKGGSREKIDTLDAVARRCWLLSALGRWCRIVESSQLCLVLIIPNWGLDYFKHSEYLRVRVLLAQADTLPGTWDPRKSLILAFATKQLAEVIRRTALSSYDKLKIYLAVLQLLHFSFSTGQGAFLLSNHFNKLV
jgi:hypothetical protein